MDTGQVDAGDSDRVVLARERPDPLAGDDHASGGDLNLRPATHAVTPGLRDAADTPIDACKPAGDRRRGIRIVTVGNGPLDGRLIVGRVGEGVPGRPEAVPNAASAAPVWVCLDEVERVDQRCPVRTSGVDATQ